MDYVLCDPNYMTFWKRQKYGDSKLISDCQREEGDGRDEPTGEIRFFRAVKLFRMKV